MDEIRDNEDYIRKNLSKDYEESLKNHKINYLTERENRIKREQEELYNEQKRIEYEDQMERERKNILKKLQYREYIKGIQEKENKLQKEFKEKLIPEEVSLPMNSDERLKKYHNNIYKLSDKADRNRKLFMEYNEKSKNDLYYNYLSKRYTLNNKEANKTIPYNRDLPLTQKFRDDINNEAIKDNTNEVNKNRTFNEHNIINEYNNSYNKYKNLYRQYDEYNRALVQQNIRKKEFMNKQREIQEEKRIEESEKLSQLKQQEKYLENEKKKLYKNFLDMQVNEQIPIKLSKENFEQNNIINSQNNNFHNSKLYDSVPQYSAINKSRFVEVNPYCLKNYDLGKSNLESNPILNPMFNYNYNKYLFGQGVSRSMSTIPTKRNKNIDIITNQIKDEKEEISQSLSPQQYLNRGYNEI
jgi:hypothetical protein